MIPIASASASTDCFGRPLRPAHRDDRLPERPGAQAELHPAAAEDVEARDALGEHQRVAEREVRHVEREADARRRRRGDGEERPRVEEAALVGVVLEGDEVEPGRVGEPRQLHDRVRPLRVRRDEDAELELLSVVAGHPAVEYQTPTFERQRVARVRVARGGGELLVVAVGEDHVGVERELGERLHALLVAGAWRRPPRRRPAGSRAGRCASAPVPRSRRRGSRRPRSGRAASGRCRRRGTPS